MNVPLPEVRPDQPALPLPSAPSSDGLPDCPPLPPAAPTSSCGVWWRLQPRAMTALAWLMPLLVPWAKRMATLAVLMVAVLVALVVWDYYVTSPWTRDGRVRVQVASVAPQ